MNQLIARKFLAAWMLLEHEIAKAEKVGNLQQIATEAERDALVRALIEVHYQCGRMGLAQSKELANGFLEQLQNPAWHHDRVVRRAILDGLPRPPMLKQVPLPSFETIYAQLRTLAEQMRQDMDAVRLAVVFKDQAQFFEQDELFGPKFHGMASVAINSEIKAAGNCLAADLPTAAVFHLMRVAERGLHALAVHLQIPQIKPYPLEFSDWREVIQAIGNKLDDMAKRVDLTPRGLAKDQEIQFNRGLLNALTFFKEAYRNPVSHLRGTYNEHGARDVYRRVEDFMKELASRVPLK
jgi:hypothetical protein